MEIHFAQLIVSIAVTAKLDNVIYYNLLNGNEIPQSMKM